MALEDSPELGKPSSTRVTFSGWFRKNKREISLLASVVVFVSLVVFFIEILPVFHPFAPGGLEGCVATKSGAPLVTTVRIGSVTRPTYDDGCFFFFPNISPGDHELIVALSSGEIILPIIIISDQAISIGTIYVGP